MPNKCLAPGDLGTQHGSMTTKKYIWILACAALLVISQLFGCKSEWTPGHTDRATSTPTPTPTPGRGLSSHGPGHTDKPTPAPY